MKILVTGGNGFIARNLFEQLTEEHCVKSCSSSELNLLDTAAVFDYLKKNKFDVVIHTATYDPAPKHSAKDPAKVLENNLRMFLSVARCKNYFGKMIYFGSGAEFDRNYWKSNMTEDYFDKYVPQDQYGFSKYLMTKYAQSSSNIYNLRVYSVFGKYEDWRYRFISRACCRAIFDLPITISQNVLYDYLYIDDLARIVKWFIQNKPENHVYNVCSGNPFESRQIAEKVAEISGKDLNVIMDDETIVRQYGGDNSLLLKELKNYKFNTLDESIKSLYGWYEANKNIIDKSEL